MTVRPATRHDIPALRGFIRRMAEESEGLRLDEAVLNAGIEAVFDRPERGTYWVAEDADGIPRACTLATVEWSDWHNAPYWWIQSLYIEPECRGKGLFQELIAALETEAREAGVPELRLYVEENNHRAIRAYEKSGFEGGHYRMMTKTIDT